SRGRRGQIHKFGWAAAASTAAYASDHHLSAHWARTYVPSGRNGSGPGSAQNGASWVLETIKIDDAALRLARHSECVSGRGSVDTHRKRKRPISVRGRPVGRRQCERCRTDLPQMCSSTLWVLSLV